MCIRDSLKVNHIEDKAPILSEKEESIQSLKDFFGGLQEGGKNPGNNN